MLTANITDDNGMVLNTASIDVTCARMPETAACLNAASGLERAHECNNDLVGILPMADFFTSTVVDVPIGGGPDRTLPGGVTLHLPATLSGELPSEADFSANGWDGSLAPPANPEPHRRRKSQKR